MFIEIFDAHDPGVTGRLKEVCNYYPECLQGHLLAHKVCRKGAD